MGGGSLYYLKYRVCLFKLLYNTRMRYLIQHLASVKHIMIPWCVYSYCEVGKRNGFCRSTSDLICDNRGIGTCVLSSLCLQISFHSYALVNQQTDYTQLHQVSLLAVISFIDQIISIKVAGEVLRNLPTLGVLKLRSLLFIIAFHWRHQLPVPCDLFLQGLCPKFNHQYACPRPNQYLTTGTLMTEK